MSNEGRDYDEQIQQDWKYLVEKADKWGCNMLTIDPETVISKQCEIESLQLALKFADLRINALIKDTK